MGKLGANTISNIISKLWSTLVIYLFVPLYIKYLGETAYGLVSFFATLQAAMNLLGLGLSNTLRREFAVGSSNDIQNGNRKFKLLRSIELIYYVLGVIVFFICFMGSSFIASKWLNAETLDSGIVSIVISLMGASIALQMVANMYAGCLFGLELQVRANVYCVIWSALKSIGSLLIIISIKPDLILFYAWHIIIDILYLLLMRFSISRNLKYDKKEKWSFHDFYNLKTIWKYTVGILIISFIALINKQLDKVIISGYMTLTELGAYNTTTTLGGLVTILPAALFTSIFPRFTSKANKKDLNKELVNEFLMINKMTNICVSCIGAFIALFSDSLIRMWTHSDIYANLLTYVAPIVVLAITMIEYQEIPYALALAYGNTKINVLVGIIFIPFIALSTWLGIKYYGLMGAACVYFITMFMQTILYEYLVYKKYISDNPILIIFRDTVIPIIVAFVLAFVFHKLVLCLTESIILQFFLAILSGIISLLVSYLILCFKEIKTITKRIKAK